MIPLYLDRRDGTIVKIVKEYPFEYQFTCTKCKSELIAEVDDVEVGYFGASYDGSSGDRLYYVTCPVCGTDELLVSSQLTPKAREAADKKDPRNRL